MPNCRNLYFNIVTNNAINTTFAVNTQLHICPESNLTDFFASIVVFKIIFQVHISVALTSNLIADKRNFLHCQIYFKEQYAPCNISFWS